jgi:hypothetical protein
MRRLIHTIVSYENGELRDDATAAMLQWHASANRPVGHRQFSHRTAENG